MSIEDIKWYNELKEFFEKEEIKDQWIITFKDFPGGSRIWESGRGNFYIN